MQPTTRLVQFLDQHNLKTTHFMIGSHILLNPTIFLQAYNSGNDLAVHTWSHHHLTSQTDLEVVSEVLLVISRFHPVLIKTCSLDGPCKSFTTPPVDVFPNTIVRPMVTPTTESVLSPSRCVFHVSLSSLFSKFLSPSGLWP